MIDKEGLMRPKAQKQSFSVFHISRIFFLEKGQSSHNVLLFINVPEKIYTLTECPNVSRAFVMQYGKSKIHLSTFFLSPEYCKVL